jgi:hypothetical protein
VILVNFVPIRLAGRDDANDFAALPITVTDDEHSHGYAQSQEHKPLLIFRVFGVVDQTRVVVQERRLRFGERDPVFAPIGGVLFLVPFLSPLRKDLGPKRETQILRPYQRNRRLRRM